ncbi:MAG: DUF1499 domain-containing protein [Tateyamaria sp.]|jgi:uncharacterized protein (DUF1499 family)|nr:DUF1499 domain-containing protein [Tateyamaria sp.]
MYIYVIIAIFLCSALFYIRLAPTDVAHWHQPVRGSEDASMMGGAVRVLTADATALARVDSAAIALPRTVRIAGSVDQGRITYLTRSKLIGFPDFTTVEYSEGQLKMFARLRFGRSDFGVNAARLKRLQSAAVGQ